MSRLRWWLGCRWWDLIQCRAPGESFESEFGDGRVVCSRVRLHPGEHIYNRTEMEVWPPPRPLP